MAIVKIEIISDTSKAAGPLKEVSSACDKVKSSVIDMVKSFAPLALATAAIAKLSSSIASAIPDTQKLASEIGRLQRITGMSAETASEYIAVFDQVGVSFGALENSVTAIARKMGGLKGIEDMVTDASGKMVDVFEKFDIQIKNSDGSLKTFSDVFEQIRGKIKSASSETERMAIATQFFKGNAAELMPVLTMSAKQWQEIAADAKKYGIILSQDNVNAVKQYTMAQRDMDDAVSGLKLTIGNELIPILKESIIGITEAIASVREFVAENKALLSLPWDILKTIKNNFHEIAGAITVMMTVAKAEAIALLITRLTTLSATLTLTTLQVKTLGAGLALLAGYEIGKKIDEWTYKLTKIDISGMNKVKEVTANVAEQMEYLNSRSGKQKDILQSLGFEGAGAMKQFNDAVKDGTIVFDQFTGQWMKKAPEVKAGAEQSAEAIKKMVDELAKAAAEIDKVGEAQLKMAGEGFNEALKTAGDNIDALRTATASYLAVIENVYSKRLAGEKAVAELMKKAGADPAALAQQQAKILETEISGANARLGAWKQYYGVLEGLHKSALDKMAQKTQQLFDLEKSRMAQENGYADLQNSLRQKLMTDEQKYYDQLEILRMKYDAAQLLSGEAKIKALTDWQSARAAMANEIKSGDAVIISQETAVKEAMQAIAMAQDDIAREYAETKVAREAELAQLASYTQELETAMAFAADMVDDYRQSIVELDAELEVQRILSIDALQAKQAISDVQAALNSIPDVTYKQVIVQYFTEASPVRPFTEGMRYINEMMNSLPTESRHTVKFGPLTNRIMGNAAAFAETPAAEDTAVKKDAGGGMSASVSGIFSKLSLKLSEALGNAASAKESKRQDIDGVYAKYFAGEIARSEATARVLVNALDQLKRGVPDDIARNMEEIFLKMATAAGSRAFNEEAKRHDIGGDWAKVYESEIKKEAAVVRALQNAIDELLRSIGGSYADGTRSVPETGLYRLHQGEAVIPAAMNPFKNNQSSTTPSQQTNISFAPTVQVISSGDAKADAANIDAEIATLWRGNRSRLRQEFEQPVGRR